ncbi:MAG: PH domain-containing protein [Coriobacteriia bacterium]|nr:PH domain-containing protein [Coriobacteriia bacterium]
MRPKPSRKLNKRITRVWRLSAAINVILWAGIPTIVLLLIAVLIAGSGNLTSGEKTAVSVLYIIFAICALVFLALLVVFVVIVPKIRWIQWSFEIYEEEIDIHKGIFWHKRIIIPLVRVQNIDTRQGPLLRMMGLSSFTVATAAGEHEIPGLETAEADALRDRVAILARIAQEDV